MGDLIHSSRAQDALDGVLPEHMYKGAVTGQRFWTNANGSFRLRTEGSHPDIRFVFHNDNTGWQLQVPSTGTGLEALVIGMILAGAIQPNDVTPYLLLQAVRGLRPPVGRVWPTDGWCL